MLQYPAFPFLVQSPDSRVQTEEDLASSVNKSPVYCPDMKKEGRGDRRAASPPRHKWGARARLSPEPRARTAEPEASRIIGRNRPTGTRRNGRECKPRETPTDGPTDGRTDGPRTNGRRRSRRRLPSIASRPRPSVCPVDAQEEPGTRLTQAGRARRNADGRTGKWFYAQVSTSGTTRVETLSG